MVRFWIVTLTAICVAVPGSHAPMKNPRNWPVAAHGDVVRPAVDHHVAPERREVGRERDRAAGKARIEGDGVEAGMAVGVGNGLAERNKAVEGIDRVVERGDDELREVTRLEGAEVGDIGPVIGDAREIGARRPARIEVWRQSIVAGIDRRDWWRRP